MGYGRMDSKWMRADLKLESSTWTQTGGSEFIWWMRQLNKIELILFYYLGHIPFLFVWCLHTEEKELPWLKTFCMQHLKWGWIFCLESTFSMIVDYIRQLIGWAIVDGYISGNIILNHIEMTNFVTKKQVLGLSGEYARSYGSNQVIFALSD